MFIGAKNNQSISSSRLENSAYTTECMSSLDELIIIGLENLEVNYIKDNMISVKTSGNLENKDTIVLNLYWPTTYYAESEFVGGCLAA